MPPISKQRRFLRSFEEGGWGAFGAPILEEDATEDVCSPTSEENVVREDRCSLVPELPHPGSKFPLGLPLCMLLDVFLGLHGVLDGPPHPGRGMFSGPWSGGAGGPAQEA